MAHHQLRQTFESFSSFYKTTAAAVNDYANISHKVRGVFAWLAKIYDRTALKMGLAFDRLQWSNMAGSYTAPNLPSFAFFEGFQDADR